VWKREQDDAWVPMNGPVLRLFRFHVGWLWYRMLSRRSQNTRLNWGRMNRLIAG
jgi:hypothetical protein